MSLSPSDPSQAITPQRSSAFTQSRLFALIVLFGMNLLNYVDRYSFYAVGTHIQDELRIDHGHYGELSASFMIVYTLVSPFMGPLGDRYNRRWLLAAGVGLWSVATVGTAFSKGYWDMFFWRSLLGVGEATYGVIAPSLLADLFPPRDRGRAMGVYYLALPTGGAVGYGIGGWVADAWNWRAAFWVVGLPGLLVAAAGLWIHDPGRGASEESGATSTHRPTIGEYLRMFTVPTFLLNTLGMAAVTFTTGAYAVFGSTFYQTVRGMTAKQAGVWIGGMTFLAGLLGIAAGTWLADRMLRVTRRAYLLLAFFAVCLAVPFGSMALLDSNLNTSLPMLFVAMTLMAMVLGPCNTVIANVVPANRRASGFAAYIFLVHILGDISSPILIGKAADWLGRPDQIDSMLGRLAASVGATPVGSTNLTAGMLLVMPVLILGAGFFLIGSRFLPEDQLAAQGADGASDHAGASALIH
ncbi:MAG: MFS transporter [Isosphaeraceae bacterium]